MAFNIGADVSYLLNPRYGVGGFIRYVGGSVDLPERGESEGGRLSDRRRRSLPVLEFDRFQGL